MERFVIEDKTGFVNNKPYTPLIINDFRGDVFYNTTGYEPVFKFNLPSLGSPYTLVKGNITPLPKPVEYKLLSIPKPNFSARYLKGKERDKPIPTHFTIMSSTNPNKCTIDWDAELIIFDSEILENYSLPQIYFILYHEYGHAKYKTEKLADLWSANRMLKEGFNPSQIAEAPITALSDKQYLRKVFMTENIIDNYGS